MDDARVVLLIFDEMDQKVTFETRPKNVELPELERLRSESVYGTKVYQPGTTTSEGIGSLTTGRPVSFLRQLGVGKALLGVDDDASSAAWSEQPSLFSKVRRMRLNAAASGYAVPYCPLFGSDLAECSWEVRPWVIEEASAEAEGLAGAMRQGLESVLRASFLKVGTSSHEEQLNILERRYQLEAYQSTQANALSWVTRPELNLLFFHWIIPHPFGIYDRETDDFSLALKSNYFDNLELVDRTVGEIRRAMEDSGQWDRTTVVLAADHPLRPGLWQRPWNSELEEVTQNRYSPLVPFLLKLPGNRRE